MTRDELMALARQAGHIPDRFISASTLERFAELVAAAELRRLAKVEDEWMALSQDQGKLEGQIDRLVAQRDALLAALRMWLHLHDSPAGYEGKYGKALDAAIAAQQVKIDAAANASRAAIKAVEERA